MTALERREPSEAEIAALKQLLNQTDYKALKHADGAIAEEDYAQIKAQRQGYRDRINELEEHIAEVTAARQAVVDALGSRPTKAQLLEAAELLGVYVYDDMTNPELYEDVARAV